MGIQGTITSAGMRLIITDTNVLFDLIKIGAVPEFFSPDLEICTTVFVIEEIKPPGHRLHLVNNSII